MNLKSKELTLVTKKEMSTTAFKKESRDPFNWPMPQRNELMSATGGLKAGSDLFQMKKENMLPKKRLESANMRSDDIEGTLLTSLLFPAGKFIIISVL